MEAFEAMPRMQASELAKRAENYAGELVQHLEKLNAEVFSTGGDERTDSPRVAGKRTVSNFWVPLFTRIMTIFNDYFVRRLPNII